MWVLRFGIGGTDIGLEDDWLRLRNEDAKPRMISILSRSEVGHGKLERCFYKGNILKDFIGR